MSEEVNGSAPDNGEVNKAPDQGRQEPNKQEGSIPKARFDQVVAQRKAAETALQEVVDGLVEDIPEDKRDLIPDLAPAEKVKWLRKATKAGIFGNQVTSGPDAQRPGGKPPTNFDNMSPHDMRARGYK
ncbi:MAG: hypothetical protein ABIK12_03455 [Pseudomonadota bacterium]